MPAKPDPRSKDRKRRSEVVTVRLDPRLKYLAELAARRQRRPLSSYIEWAIEGSLSNVMLAYDPTRDGPESLTDVASDLWDVDEPDRFAKLALRYPDLLDHEEQRLWKLIRENGGLWRGGFVGPERRWQWTVEEGSLMWTSLRMHWETFCKVARGEAKITDLPSWIEFQATGPSNDLDDEIPF